jgi:hypothetical protein
MTIKTNFDKATSHSLESVRNFFKTGNKIEVGPYAGDEIYMFGSRLNVASGKDALNLRRNKADTGEKINVKYFEIFEPEVKKGRMTDVEYSNVLNHNILPERYYTDMGAIKARLEAGEYSKRSKDVWHRHYIEFVKKEDGTASIVYLSWDINKWVVSGFPFTGDWRILKGSAKSYVFFLSK